MAWRLAKSLEVLRAQVNIKWPKRNKASDGTIGDTRHSKTKSDHNPDSKGRVCAFDITRDPVNGPDLSKLIPVFLADKRTKYIIYNSKIYNPTIGNGAARPYSGSNAHKSHLHLSVTQAGADDAKPWAIPDAGVATTAPAQPHSGRALLKKGMSGGDVPVLQLALNRHGQTPPIATDGIFGPKTEAAVKAFQTRNGLKADGLAGPLTWAKLAALDVAAPVVPAEQNVNEAPKPKPETVPQQAIETFMGLGWSKLVSVALVASMVWESGGNTRNPWTIVWDAKGDKDKSGNYHAFGGSQWLGPRYDALKAFAEAKDKPWTDGETQLAFMQHELLTTEKRAAALLKASTSIEEAMAAAITFWRPSQPHAEKRLAIARTLLASI